MPRLDNSTQETVAAFGDLDEWNWDDPGQNQPFDFCLECWDFFVHHEFADLEIDHPPYENMERSCIKCGAPLFELDNLGYL